MGAMKLPISSGKFRDNTENINSVQIMYAFNKKKTENLYIIDALA